MSQFSGLKFCGGFISSVPLTFHVCFLLTMLSPPGRETTLRHLFCKAYTSEKKVNKSFSVNSFSWF